MNCPGCGSADLAQVFCAPGVLLDQCPACRGIWFDHGELDRFVRQRDLFRDGLARAFSVPAPTPRKCHRCRRTMEQGRLDGVLLDRCPLCLGLWCDKGEAHALAAKLDKAPEPDPGAPSWAPTSAEGGAAGGTSEGHAAGAASPWAAGAAPAAAGAALPALPSLALRSTAVLASLYGLLAAFLFGLGAYGILPPDSASLIGAIIVLLQFLLSPWLMDLSLAWLQGVRWTGPSIMPAGAQAFLSDLCRERGVAAPRVGVIEDGNPNAFTYGHHPGNARLVLTRGALDLLDEEELKAVVGHEMGHALHWDMLVMTVAALVPYLLYHFHRVLSRMTRRKRSGGSRKGSGEGAVATAALAALLLYYVTSFLLLYLSRLRELYADRFSGDVTRNPNALASALVKIAYGLAGRPAPKDGEERGAETTPLRALGIFDPGAAKALAASSAGVGARADPMQILGAMQWDMWNPWAAYYELQSTHPLPAKRIALLGRQALTLGQPPFIHFNLRKPESYWDEFLVDLGALWLPGLLAGAFAAADWLFARGADGRGLAGGALIGYAVGYLLRLMFSYPSGSYGDATVAGLLKQVKVSAVRGIPARLKGPIIGRGTPGHVFSEDMVLRDATGIVLLDHSQPLGLLETWFALARRRDFDGKDVTAEGYYRRSPVPYIELRRIQAEGASSASWTLEAKIAFGALAALAGLYLGFGDLLPPGLRPF